MKVIWLIDVTKMMKNRWIRSSKIWRPYLPMIQGDSVPRFMGMALIMKLLLKLKSMPSLHIRRLKGGPGLPILINIKRGFRNLIYLVEARLITAWLSIRPKCIQLRWHHLARKWPRMLMSLWASMIPRVNHTVKFK